MALAAQQVISIVAEYIDKTRAGMEQTKANFTKVQTAAGRLQGGLGRLNTGIKSIINNAIRFRMELLSVMFFGMALQRLFLGLLRPAFDLVGIFEIWTTILELLFLPVALLLLPFLLDLLKWVMDLPEEIKKVIGMFVILGVIFGTALLVIGTLGLGIMGLVTTFVNLAGGIAGIAGPFSGILQALLLLAGGAVGVKVGFAAWDLIRPIVSKLFKQLGLSEKARELLKKLGIEVKEGESIWEALRKKVSSVISSMLENLGISTGDIQKWRDNINEAFDFIDKHWTRLKDKLVEGLRRFAVALGHTTEEGDDLWDTLDDIFTTIEDMIPPVMQLGGEILKAFKDVDMSKLLGDLKEMFKFVRDIFNMVKGIWDALEGVNQAFAGKGAQVMGREPRTWQERFTNIQVGLLASLSDIISRGLGGLPTPFQHGGLVTRPTLAMVGEAGPEMITPLGEGVGAVTIAPTYNISASISSDIDIRTLAAKLNDLLVTDYRRLAYR